MTWLPITLLAVTAQLLRNTFSKTLSKKLSPETVSLCRFLYGIPLVAAAYIIGSYFFGDVNIISINFFIWIFIFAASQIVANALLIALFHHKNFAVSITFIKSETIFTTIMAFVFLSEKLSIIEASGVIIAFTGLLITSFARQKASPEAVEKSLSYKGTYLGLLSGFFFAITAIAIKTAFTFLETDVTFMRSTFTLLSGQITAVALLIPYILFKRKKEFFEIIKKPKIPLTIGALASIASSLWFFAFAIAFLAHVKTIGQLEFIFGIFISAYYFKEKINKNEIFGMIVMVTGTLIIIFT